MWIGNSKIAMLKTNVSIVEWVDDSEPGIVKCLLKDAWGHTFTFIDKVPMFTPDRLDEQGPFPLAGIILCEVVRRWSDDRGRDIVTVDVDIEHSRLEAETGETTFDVLAGEVTEYVPRPVVPWAPPHRRDGDADGCQGSESGTHPES